MFSHGLRSLLTCQAEVEIIGEESNIDQAILQMEALGPDVIIISDSGRMDDFALEEMRLLKTKPGIKVIGLSLQNNDLFIYHSARVEVTGEKDLITAITDQVPVELAT
jgi:DNA-binding NarL/FixJ family response regulator